jgi:hypothetical protein
VTEAFERRVDEHRSLLIKRGFALAAEHMPPRGQAALWHQDVIHVVPRSGREVAKQLARLVGDDSKVTIPWRSLADAVGRADKAGHTRGYTERGVAALVEAGWLHVETIGQKRGARTTFYLLPGDRPEYKPWWLDTDDDENLEEWLEWVA